MEIRGKTITHASYVNKLSNDREQRLIKEIEILQQSGNYNNEEIQLKKVELVEMRKTKMRGVLVRSRTKWIEEGDKPTIFVGNLEHRNDTCKHMSKRRRENDSIIF